MAASYHLSDTTVCYVAAARRVLLAMHAAIDARCAQKDGLEALAGRMELLEAHCSPQHAASSTAGKGDGSDSDEEDLMGTAARPRFLDPQVKRSQASNILYVLLAVDALLRKHWHRKLFSCAISLQKPWLLMSITGG